MSGQSAGTSMITVTAGEASSKCYVFVSEQPICEGWHKSAKKKYYYLDDTPLRNLQLIGRKLYLFNNTVFNCQKDKIIKKEIRKDTSADKIKKMLKK